MQGSRGSQSVVEALKSFRKGLLNISEGAQDSPTQPDAADKSHQMNEIKSVVGDFHAGLKALSCDDLKNKPEPEAIEVDGLRGPRGPPGRDGRDGKDGDDGLSAYDIWVMMGHRGTAQAFLRSLKGDKGDKGDKGERGERGPAGISTGGGGGGGSAGAPGLSAYEIWLALGNVGTEQDFIDSLSGSSAPVFGILDGGSPSSAYADTPAIDCSNAFGFMDGGLPSSSYVVI